MLEALDLDEGGARWLPFAKHKLQILKVVLQGTGQKFGRKVYVTPDGKGQVYIRTRKGQSRIAELLREKTGRVVPVPYSQDDAIDEWYDYIRISTCTERMGFILFRDRVPFDPNEFLAYYVDGKIERIVTILPNADVAHPPKRSIGYKPPTELQGVVFDTRNTASRYSGIMRKAVGCYHIRGQDAPFSYSWTKTHGIVKFSSQAGEPQDLHWLVEVSAAGVFAAPISNTGDCCTSWGVRHYQPTTAQLEQDASLQQYVTQISLEWALTGRPESGVVRIMEAPELVTAYSRQPFFSGHGWAFNYSGTEAQAVTQEWFLTPARHYKCSRYKLVFSLHGEELRCALSAVETDAVASFISGRVWSPTTLGEWIGANLGDATSRSTFPNQSAPVHVYYIGDAEEVVRFQLTNYDSVTVDQSPTFTFVDETGTTVNIPFGYYNLVEVPNGTVAIFDSVLEGSIVTQNELTFIGPTHQYTYQVGYTSGFVASAFGTINDSRAFTKIDDVLAQSGTQIVSETLSDTSPPCSFTYVRETEVFLGTQTRITKTGSQSGHGSLVLFIGEREAVLSVRDNSLSETQHTQYGTRFKTYEGLPVQKSMAVSRWHTQNPVGNPDCAWAPFNWIDGTGSGGWPFGVNESLEEGGTAPYSEHPGEAILMVGSNSAQVAIGNNDTLLAFFGLTAAPARSSVFAMHGNLYDPDPKLTPVDQKANAAFYLDQLQFAGGFAEPANTDPYSVIAFVGKA